MTTPSLKFILFFNNKKPFSAKAKKGVVLFFTYRPTFTVSGRDGHPYHDHI